MSAHTGNQINIRSIHTILLSQSSMLFEGKNICTVNGFSSHSPMNDNPQRPAAIADRRNRGDRSTSSGLVQRVRKISETTIHGSTKLSRGTNHETAAHVVEIFGSG